MQLAARKAGVVKADGPLLVEMNFCFQIPRSWSKRDQALAREMQVMPCSKPDIDNCIKLVLDALNGIGWLDDRQIIGIVARKYYSVQPHTYVGIWEVNDEEPVFGYRKAEHRHD